MSTAVACTTAQPATAPTDDVVSLIRQRAHMKARWMVETACFPLSDRDDFEQDLVFQTLERMPEFDPARGSLRKYINEVLFNLVGDMLRKRDRRDERCTIETVSTPDLVQVADERATSKTNTRDREYLISDLDDFLATLPPQMRELCQRLKTQSWSDALAAMGIPRSRKSTLQKELQELFTEAGFSPADLAAC